ncbi:hypothetical protein LTR09_007739 [Extremus antarcticus]|uniref:Uncharacterized protein n=1 Tax=Extremus antarcticus TaxID=702011 RepID=A0AAJ0DIR8_9PEZI|nr:hypothetical protein LTR09_007739 [Extremus antarcticus]
MAGDARDGIPQPVMGQSRHQTPEKPTSHATPEPGYFHVSNLPPYLESCKPHSDDAIFTQARAYLISHNRKSFTNFTNPIRVEAITDEATVEFEHESAIAELALVYRKSVIPFCFKLVRAQSSTSPTLMCDVKGGWRSFEEWLGSLKCPPGRKTLGKKGSRSQQQWWSKTGKTFEIMALPAEIRLLILEQAVCVEHFHNPFANEPFGYFASGSRTMDMYYDEPGRIREKKLIGRPNTNVLFSCRQIYSEIKPHLQTGAIKNFEYDYELGRYMSNPGFFGLGGVRSIRHLTLDLISPDGYRTFFGLQSFYTRRFCSPGMLYQYASQYSPGAALLRTLPDLRSIRIHFRASMYGAYDRADPWDDSLPMDGIPQLDETVGLRGIVGFYTPCLKSYPDLILNFAKMYIEHVPQILLTGAIKPSVKEKWDNIFASNASYDVGPQRMAMTRLEYSKLSSYECKCSTPCGFEPYYGIVRRREGMPGESQGQKSEKFDPGQYEFVKKKDENRC